MCIDINLTQQRLRAYQGQTVVIDALVSTGTIEHPTVEGKFRIYLKYLSAPMSGGSKEGGDYYNLPDVPDIMYFFDGYGIHGTYWHHNFGRPMSHGCVNMRTDQAAWLFNWAPVGTLVFIHK
jgi:lipoprotein-anchoring transpeptidase ErfK/SrfK